MRATRSLSLAVLVLAAGGSLAGCGGDGLYGSDGGTPSAQSGAPTVEVSTTSLGAVLTDGQGRTLYLFTHDSGDSSACEGACLSAWPPLEGTATAGSGANGSLLGTITRSDGMIQATYAGHPLYYYSGDQDPGDVNGQEIQDAWYVVNAEGDEVEGEGSGDSTETPTDGGGSGY